MKRVALYIRVSSEKQAKSGDSLREQEDTLNEYVKSQKDMIIHSTYIDDGISGQKLDRDEFQRLMTDVKNNQIDVILFTKLDRWFRSLKHYLNIEDVLQKYNTHWIAVSQPFYDTSTPYGRTFINQVMSFAELEAQMTSERMIAIFEHKIKMGEVASGSTPFGYSIKNKRLVPNEDAYI
ncbi:MAG: recombinase family protein, partial [Enterococcus sp.]|nr:recombinase family protein [Enterococcus sp.]